VVAVLAVLPAAASAQDAVSSAKGQIAGLIQQGRDMQLLRDDDLKSASECGKRRLPTFSGKVLC
jgi:hypothetical protein